MSSRRLALILAGAFVTLSLTTLAVVAAARGAPGAEGQMAVSEVRPGMVGIGRTVLACTPDAAVRRRTCYWFRGFRETARRRGRDGRRPWHAAAPDRDTARDVRLPARSG